MYINVHAGHNPDGKVACGAVGLIKESTCAREVKSLVVDGLRKSGHTVYDCTVDDGVGKNDVLNKIIKKCNAHAVDIDVSIHFNAAANDMRGNGKTTGTEVLVYNSKSASVPYAKKVLESICSLGFTNRGIKVRNGLAVLRRTKAPAMLIECCFVDDKDDVMLYDPEKMADAIVKAFGKG